MNSKFLKTTMLTALIATPLFTVSNVAIASPVFKHNHHSKHNPYRVGAHHRVLPHGFNVVWIANQKYYHHDQVYYKRINDAYVVVDNPNTTSTNNPMYVYPAAGQTADQQRQDRYECHVWASDQTGFDPSNLNNTTTTETVYVERHRKRQNDSGVVDGAVGGAAVGALGGAIAGDPGIGAAVGAGLGVIKNAIFKNNEPRQTHAVPVTRTVSNNNTAQNKANYDRAISACLEARLYTVR